MSNARKEVRLGGATRYVRLRPLNDKEAESPDSYLSLSAGESIVGVISSSAPNGFDEGKTDFTITTDDGTNLVITGTKSLTAKLNAVGIGNAVEIEYGGKEVMKGGRYKGKAAHNFKVFEA